MNFFVILLLALDLRVFGFNYPAFVEQYSKNARVEVYGVMDSEKCPKVVQPLCGTNGKEFLYFENKCHFEAKNYELLTQGLTEYYQCPLTYCKSVCPKCGSVNKPVCAVQVFTGAKKTFPNPCEVKRRICITKTEWRIVSIFECNSRYNNRIIRPPNYKTLHHNDCPEFCTSDYQPICARFMTMEKEFSNSCELKATICQTKQKWNIIRRGPCRKSHYNTFTEFYAIDTMCPRPCPLEYKPVCATLHKEIKVFSNKCELENALCQGNDWQIIKEGACLESRNKLEHKKCPEFCTNEYRPVCAAYKGQQKEFGNTCEMLKAICDSNIAWQILKTGPCFSYSLNTLPDFHSCPQFCPKEYKPVCAEFNNQIREFGNKCEMQKAICETNTNWQLLKKGQCPFALAPRKSCPNFCTKEFSPICVNFDGKLKEFPNSCELKKISCETDSEWELLHRGPCIMNHIKKPVESSCENEALDPICATYNSETKTFNNLCQLAEEIKYAKTNWSILHKGICSNTSPATSTSVFTSSKPTTLLLESTTTSEDKYTTAATTSTTLKSSIYQIKEQTTTPYETTIYTTTNNPETTTTECSIYAPMETSTNNENSEVSEEIEDNSKEYDAEDVVDDSDSGSHEDSSSTANYGTTSTFSYEESSEKQLNTSHSYETKPCANNNYAKAKNSTNSSEGYSEENDASDALASEEKFAKTYEIYLEDNVASERTSKEQGKYANENYSGDSKSNEKYKESKSNEKYKDSKGSGKYHSDALKKSKEKLYSTNSKAIRQENKIELKISGRSNKKDHEEKLTNNKKIISNGQRLGENKKNGTDFQTKNYMQGKSLTKWIKQQIQDLLSRMGKSQSSQESNSDEEDLYSLQRLKADSNENRKENTSFKEYRMSDNKSQQKDPSFNLTNLNHMNKSVLEFGAYGNEIHDKQNQTEDKTNKVDSNFNVTYESAPLNQTQASEQASKYSTQSETHITYNTKSNLKIYEISLTKSDDKDKDNESIADDNLTPLQNESNVSYPANEETDATTNQDPSKYLVSKPKKGEIYNGIVYKAPFYDAPTYNFIYTAPFNFHGIGPHHNNHLLVNQTNSGVAGKVPFDPYHFLSSIPATRGSFAKPNVMRESTAMGYGNNAHSYKHLLYTANNQSKLPPQPVKLFNNNVLPQTHVSLPVPLSPPHGHLLTSLASLNSNFAPKIPNFLSLKESEDNKKSQSKEHQNSQSVTEGYKYATATLPSILTKDHNTLPSITSQALSYPPAIPQQITKSSEPVVLNRANSPQISLNSTLLKQIVDTLKIITNRYN